ncbi:MAG: alpha/beta hydrolase [Clostridiales bacterium]|jgi:fermentation-respiration switch protein FrsA (DUF1100 family)|nr:alpha/beta hydrolase [Clostridiales bacterium]
MVILSALTDSTGGKAALIVLICAVALAVLLLGAGYLQFWIMIVRKKNSALNGVTLKAFSKLMGTYVDAFIEHVTANAKILAEFPHEDVTVTTDDGLKLMGRYFINTTPTDKTFLCMHGYSSEGMNDFAAIAQFYLKSGFNVLLPEHRAHGRSEGKYIGFGALDRFDALKWLKLITDRFPDGNIFVTGISMGGATVLQMSEFDLPKNVKGIISDCAFTNVHDEAAAVVKFLTKLPAFPLVNLASDYCKMLAKYDFTSVDSSNSVKNAKVPILFIHGTGDLFIPHEMTVKCYENCSTEKQLVLVEGAGHGSEHFHNTELYESSVKAFIDKYDC